MYLEDYVFVYRYTLAMGVGYNFFFLFLKKKFEVETHMDIKWTFVQSINPKIEVNCDIEIEW